MSSIKVAKQYIKELSVKVPKSPEIFATTHSKPNIEISINLEARKISDQSYEVILQLTAVADSGNLFEITSDYAGIFYFEKEFATEDLEEILLVECPTLLFPFARNIISNCAIDAGFSPLMIDPIDFNLLYEKRRESFTIN